MLILCYKLPSICGKVTDAALWIGALNYVCVLTSSITYFILKRLGIGASNSGHTQIKG